MSSKIVADTASWKGAMRAEPVIKRGASLPSELQPHFLFCADTASKEFRGGFPLKPCGEDGCRCTRILPQSKASSLQASNIAGVPGMRHARCHVQDKACRNPGLRRNHAMVATESLKARKPESQKSQVISRNCQFLRPVRLCPSAPGATVLKSVCHLRSIEPVHSVTAMLAMPSESSRMLHRRLMCSWAKGMTACRHNRTCSGGSYVRQTCRRQAKKSSSIFKA